MSRTTAAAAAALGLVDQALGTTDSTDAPSKQPMAAAAERRRGSAGVRFGRPHSATIPKPHAVAPAFSEKPHDSSGVHGRCWRAANGCPTWSRQRRRSLHDRFYVCGGACR